MKRWRFVGPDVVSWYVNFSRAHILYMISVWGNWYPIKKVYPIRSLYCWSRPCLWQLSGKCHGKKTSFRASKWPQKTGTWKTVKKRPRWKTFSLRQCTRWVNTDVHLDKKIKNFLFEILFIVCLWLSKSVL